MFDTLTDRFQKIFKNMRGHGRLTEDNINEAVREAKRALLEADVHYSVVKDMMDSVKTRALGQTVFSGVSPHAQFIKIVHDTLVSVLGEAEAGIRPAKKGYRILLAGLQGSGKTTTAVKLAYFFQQQGKKTLLVAGDFCRPAAEEQLRLLAAPWTIPVFSVPGCFSLDEFHSRVKTHIENSDFDLVIYDTAGRHDIESEMMAELRKSKDQYRPHEVLLVIDAMTGQKAVEMAQAFAGEIGIDGLVLTKCDGDARGGAALSIFKLTGCPIKFLGTGEKIDGLEGFYPSRLATRILGKGDIVGFVEKIQKAAGETDEKEMARKIRKSTFDLEDLQKQLKILNKMGGLSQWLDLLPGMSVVKSRMKNASGNPAGTDEKALKKIDAIINSMTLYERKNPDRIDLSRRRRIARGSGTQHEDVTDLLKKFDNMKKMTKNMAKFSKMNKMVGLS